MQTEITIFTHSISNNLIRNRKKMKKIYLICIFIVSFKRNWYGNSSELDYIEFEDEDWITTSDFDIDNITAIAYTELDDIDETPVNVNDLIIAESKIQELSLVLKSTVHRIRQQHKKLDVVFLIDSSSSVGKSNFRSEVKFVVKFLSDFNVSFNYTRVAIVTFSSQENIVCYFQNPRFL